MSIRHKLLGGISAIAFAGFLTFVVPNTVGAQEENGMEIDCTQYQEEDALGFLEQDVPEECMEAAADEEDDLFADFADEEESSEDGEEDFFAEDEDDLFAEEEEDTADNGDGSDDPLAENEDDNSANDDEDMADTGDGSDEGDVLTDNDSDAGTNDDEDVADNGAGDGTTGGDDEFDDLFSEDTGDETTGNDDLFGDSGDGTGSDEGDDVVADSGSDDGNLDDPSASGDTIGGDDNVDSGNDTGDLADGDTSNGTADDAVANNNGDAVSGGAASGDNGSVIALTVGQGLDGLANDPASAANQQSVADVVIGNDPNGGSKDNIVQLSALQVFDDGSHLSISVLDAVGGDTDPTTAVLNINADNAPDGAPSGLPTLESLAAVSLAGVPGNSGTDALLEVGLPLLNPVGSALGINEITVLEAIGGNTDPASLLLNLR